MTNAVPLFFDRERRLYGAIARERDLAASAPQADQRQAHIERSRRLAAALPQTCAERLLLTLS